MDGWRPFAGEWGLVLGASSGFGAAIARSLARHGMGIVGVHLDRKSTLAAAASVEADVRAAGAPVQFFNVNAADADPRIQVCDHLRTATGGRVLRAIVHSLAFGTLRPFVSDDPGQQTTKAQLEMTLDVMAHSLVYWVQDLRVRGLVGDGTRIFAMTSAGGTRVLPAYGAVSAAKAALEAHVRQLAAELGAGGGAGRGRPPRRAGTAAARRIPSADVLLAEAARRNPAGRLTTPEDVAGAIVALCLPGTRWISGNVLGVDGGEDVIA